MHQCQIPVISNDVDTVAAGIFMLSIKSTDKLNLASNTFHRANKQNLQVVSQSNKDIACKLIHFNTALLTNSDCSKEI